MALTDSDIDRYIKALMRRGMSETEANAMAYRYIKRHMDPINQTERPLGSAAESVGPLAGIAADRAIENLLSDEAVNVAWNAPAMAETLGAGIASSAEANAAWNATAMGGEVLPEVALPSSYSAIPGLIGAGLAFDVLSNKKSGGRGALEGGLAGAGIGWSFGGPMGALVGAPIGAGIGYFGNFGDRDEYLTEFNRAEDLRGQGIDWDLNTQEPTAGRSKEDLVSQAIQNIASGQYGNPKFAESRNESDLSPEDIWGYSQWGEKFGNDWLKIFSEDQRRQISQLALNQGLVREHHGTIDVNFNSDFDEQVKKILSGELKVETTPWTPGEGGESGGQGGTINVNIVGSVPGQSNSNANATAQAMMNMALSNDDSINLINQYKKLGALSQNEAAQAAFTLGQLNKSS